MQWFIAEAIGPKVHGNENFRAKIFEGTEGLLRIHMIFSEFGAVICPNWKERDFWVEFFSNLTESVKVTRITSVVDGLSA